MTAPAPPEPPSEPVFAEPWQAQAFAMVVSLHQRGLFTWPQWAEALGRRIASAPSCGAPDAGDTYYHHWLAALEDVLHHRQLASAGELQAWEQAWAQAAAATPHGQPIPHPQLPTAPPVQRRGLALLLAGACLAVASGWPTPTWAQNLAGHWPDKPITLIVPFPPGGVADTVARPVAEALAREFKQPVMVQNRAGAGGALGIAEVAKAAPDGHTLLLSLSSISILPEADAVLGRKPTFTADSFVPIARFTADPTVLVVRADAPWKSLNEFVSAMRQRPGAYNYGSSGNYGTMHVPMEMLKSSAGFRMLHIPYTGAGPAVLALLGGQVDAVASGPATVVAHIKAGKLRALAHWGDAPLVAMPELPSLKQAGHDIRFAQWSALFAPAGTPSAVVQRLREAARKAASDPQVVATIGRAGSPMAYQDAPEFAAYWAADAKGMTEAVRRIGKLD